MRNAESHSRNDYARGRRFAIRNSFIPHPSFFILPAQRRGISLLEVLVSMGVITVGLLGILSLFPVGAYKAGMASRHDRSAALGQAAFHDIITRGLLRPDNWVVPNTGTTNNDVDWVPRNSPQYNTILNTEFSGLRPGGYAFDPLAYGESEASNQKALLSFPTNTPQNIPYLIRVTQTQRDPSNLGNSILVGRALADLV